LFVCFKKFDETTLGTMNSLQSQKNIFVLVVALVNLVVLYFIPKEKSLSVTALFYYVLCHLVWMLVLQRNEWEMFWKNFWIPLRHHFKIVVWLTLVYCAYSYPFLWMGILGYVNLSSLQFLNSLSKPTHPTMETIPVQNFTEKYRLQQAQFQLNAFQTERRFPQSTAQHNEVRAEIPTEPQPQSQQQPQTARKRVRIQQPHDAVIYFFYNFVLLKPAFLSAF
jgi:hypothetical protein